MKLSSIENQIVCALLEKEVLPSKEMAELIWNREYDNKTGVLIRVTMFKLRKKIGEILCKRHVGYSIPAHEKPRLIELLNMLTPSLPSETTPDT